MLQFLERVVRAFPGERSRQAGEILGLPNAASRGKQLFQPNGGAFAGRGLDLEMVHQAARAQNSEPHAGGGLVAALENIIEPADPGPRIRDLYHKELWGSAALN